MSRPGPSGLQADLLADLQVDRTARPVAGGQPAPPAGPVHPAVPQPPRPTPVLELRVTPLHWYAPRVARLPAGWGVTIRGGPLQLAVTLLPVAGV